MRKLTKIVCAFMLFIPVLCFGKTAYKVKADEVETPAQTTILDEIDELDTNEDGEIDENELIEKIKNKLGEFIDLNTVANIITWLASSGILTFALTLLNKVKKYKDYDTTGLIKEFDDKITKAIKEQIDELGEEKINELKDTINEIVKAEETIMKVLVLMQDNTAKGKVALIDYLGAKTNSNEVKDAVNETKETLELKEQAVNEAKEEIKKDYEEIF